MTLAAHPDEAEEKYKEALDIERELAKDNPDLYIGDIVMILNNMAIIYVLHNFSKEIRILWNNYFTKHQMNGKSL